MTIITGMITNCVIETIVEQCRSIQFPSIILVGSSTGMVTRAAMPIGK